MCSLDWEYIDMACCMAFWFRSERTGACPFGGKWLFLVAVVDFFWCCGAWRVGEGERVCGLLRGTWVIPGRCPCHALFWRMVVQGHDWLIKIWMNMSLSSASLRRVSEVEDSCYVCPSLLALALMYWSSWRLRQCVSNTSTVIQVLPCPAEPVCWTRSTPRGIWDTCLQLEVSKVGREFEL